MELARKLFGRQPEQTKANTDNEDYSLQGILETTLQRREDVWGEFGGEDGQDVSIDQIQDLFGIENYLAIQQKIFDGDWKLEKIGYDIGSNLVVLAQLNRMQYELDDIMRMSNLKTEQARREARKFLLEKRDDLLEGDTAKDPETLRQIAACSAGIKLLLSDQKTSPQPSS